MDLKLMEELQEYYKSGDVEELTDLVEIVNAILEYKGVSEEEFKHLMLKKRNDRGGFKKRLFLISVEEK